MLTKYFDQFGRFFPKTRFGTHYTSQWNTEVGQVTAYWRAVFSASWVGWAMWPIWPMKCEQTGRKHFTQGRLLGLAPALLLQKLLWLPVLHTGFWNRCCVSRAQTGAEGLEYRPADPCTSMEGWSCAGPRGDLRSRLCCRTTETKVKVYPSPLLSCASSNCQAVYQVRRLSQLD